jgi:ADP-heptose:LPS heptosyltransferase
MTTTLVIRFSSLGDVAITIPALYSVAKNYPDDRFLLLTRNVWRSLFVNKPPNLMIFHVHTKGEHKGIKGMMRLLREVSSTVHKKKVKVADLHGVIRSFVLDCYFRLKGFPVAVIDKGRNEKRELIRQENKIMRPLKTSLDRYREVLEKLGYDSSLNFTGLFPEKPVNEQIKIGIAPFAKHRGKIYPLEQMENVVFLLNKLPNLQITLLGSKEERKLLETWVEKYPNVTSAAGHLSLQEELFLMNQMNLIVSMD